jgi:iron complex outermembrane receptor protein
MGIQALKIFRITLAAITAASFISPLALAEVEEITVSAQRRDDNLQEVPISISSFSVDDMEKLQINAVGDVAAAVPNMKTYDVTANASAMQVFMRGAGVQNPGFNSSESPVGIYVDDVYRGRLATANIDLTDIERVEVLRGPQGTLYGRNTIAGAVKFITRTPDDEFWGDASVAYGNYRTSKVTASVGGPLIEGKLAGSLALLYHDREDGWISRGSAGGDKLGEYTNTALRGKLHWYEGDVLDAELSVAYVDGDNDGYNGIPYGPDGSGNANPGQPLEGFYTSPVTDANKGFGDTYQLNTGLNLSWDLESVLIKSITSYSDIDDEFGFDLYGGAPPGLYVKSDSNNTTVSQELTFSGDAFGDTIPFHWIAGLFYMNEDGDQTYNPTIVSEAIDTETNSYAIYGEGTWDFTEKFAMTLGARVTRDEKDFSNDCKGLCTPSAPAIPPANWSEDLDDTFTEFTPRILLEYQLLENTMLWGSMSRGYQAGGYQTLCFGNQNCSSQVYDPETVTSTEIGVKSDFLDNTIRINAAGWYAQYSDIQQTVVDTDFSFPLVNAGDVDVLGFDVEAYWSPNEQFNAFAILGYANESFGSNNKTGSKDLPGLAKSTARAGVNWRAPIRFATDWDLLLGADIEYSDDYLSALTQQPADALTVPSYTRWNGFIGIDQPDGHWSVIASGTNLGDKEDVYSGIVDSGFGVNIRTPQPPREYMVTVKYRY